MKLFITGNYLVVTDADNNKKFKAPKLLVRIKERPNGLIKVYTEGTIQRQNHEIVLNPEVATDASEEPLTGGLVTWLITNTGA